PSLLPAYRGASPIAEALLRGDAVVGTSIVKVSLKVDAGDVYLQEKMTLEGHENAEEVWNRLAAVSAKLFVRTLDGIEDGSMRAVAQDESRATLCRKLSKEDGRIDWSADAGSIHNRVRALYLWPGAWSILEGSKVRILKSVMSEMTLQADAAPGTIVFVGREGIGVRTGGGILTILRLQMEGSRPLDAQEFLNGRNLKEGQRFDHE
ncbi:MAG: methionyl-tRNA formyltransferase, partial [Candidatus Omnitrophica bacterium]|nr:methionyl-tRNA formyltransferase [Candidatus Omnitrophota bacterium]